MPMRGLFPFVSHPDADGQADDDGAHNNNEKYQILHGYPFR